MENLIISIVNVSLLSSNDSIHTYEISYKNYTYRLNLDQNKSSEKEKSQVISNLINQFDSNLIKVDNLKSNQNYLCFKINYKLNGIKENFHYVAGPLRCV